MSDKVNLVVQTAFLGDLILSIPTLQRIKKIFPNDRLVIICKKGLGDFLLTENIVDEVIEIEKSNTQSYKKALNIILEKKIRNIFCIHRSIRSLMFVSKIKAELKIGFDSFFGFWIFDKRVPFIRSNPEVIRQIKILEPVDIELKNEILNKDYSNLNSSTLPTIPDFFSFSKNLNKKEATKKIALFPGSVWATKRWTVEGYRDLCTLINNYGYQVDLMGGPDEKGLCFKIADGLNFVNVLAGKLTISETIREINKYDLVVSNDSAPTHMASFQNTPIVTIFGPTVPAQGFRPWSNQAKIVENTNLECRPCGRHGHNQCPLGHHNCMKQIAAQQVMDSIKNLLSMKNL